MKVGRVWSVLCLGLLGMFLFTACAAGGNGTPAPTVSLPEAAPTSGPLPSTDTTVTAGTEVFTAPGLASVLSGYEVMAGKDGPVAAVDGLLLDGLTGKVQAFVVKTLDQNPAREVLLPWGVFQVVSGQADQGTSTPAPSPKIWLPGSASDLLNAPVVAQALLEHPEQMQPGWEQPALAFWQKLSPGLPVTSTQPAASPTGTSGLIFFSASPQGGRMFAVKNEAGVSIGQVEDMVIGLDGAATFAILVPDQALKLASERLPVAWKALSWIPADQSFLLHLPMDVISKAPGFQVGSLPDTTIPGWDADWHTYWDNLSAQDAAGSTPSGTQPGSLQVTPTLGSESSPLRAFSLLGRPILDLNSSEIGKLVDWTIDVQGISNFALVVTQPDGRLMPLPWLAIDRSQPDRLALNLDRAVVDKAPRFASAAELDATSDWRNTAFTYWQQYLQFPKTNSMRTEEERKLYLRVVEILGGPVTDASQAMIGSLDDVILNADGSVAYLVIHSGSILRPVPWMNFVYNFRNRSLSYIDDPIRLENAPGFARLEDINVTAPDWDAQIRSHWGMQ